MIKSFQIGAKKYKVEYSKEKSTDYLGRAYSPAGRIVIFKNNGSDPIPEDSQEQTLFHEITHCILDEMGKTDLSKDESFVQTYSLLWHQVIRSVK